MVSKQFRKSSAMMILKRLKRFLNDGTKKILNYVTKKVP